MKYKNKKLRFGLMILLVNLLISSSIFAQTSEKGSNNFNMQLGVSTPFGLPENSSSIIPQIGLDFNMNKFGIRTTGQFFKTSPEFDINAYLAPLSSYITQTGVKEKSSNILLGISPYLNLPVKKNFTLQTALGLKYLIQNRATSTVVYTQDPALSILNFPVGDAKTSSFIIDPSIRAVFGKAFNPLRFYVEAGYALALSSKESTYSYRDLTGVFLPDGTIDPDMLDMAKTITGTEEVMPSSLWIGIGLELNITSSPTSINHNTGRSNRTYPHANIEKHSNEKEKEQKDFCCDILNISVGTENVCCGRIFFNTYQKCDFATAEINSINGKQFTVIDDINGNSQSTGVLNYPITLLPNTNYPVGINYLAEICVSPRNQGDLKIEVIINQSNGVSCKETFLIACPSDTSSCCEQLDVRFGGEIPCCTDISYKTNTYCNIKSVDIESIDLTPITVQQYPLPPSPAQSNHTILPITGSYFPSAPTQHKDLVRVCVQSTPQGFVDVKLTFHFEDGSICYDTVSIICPSSNIEDCECRGWMEDKPFIISNAGQPIANVVCDGSVRLGNTGLYDITAPHYNCFPLPPSCQLTYTWEVHKVGSGFLWSDNGNPFRYNFSTPGIYTILVTPYCGNQKCPPCEFDIIIEEGGECECEGWTENKPITISNAGQTEEVFCDGNIQLGNTGSYNITAPLYNCTPFPPCLATYTWEVDGLQTGVTGNGSGNSFTFNFSVAGTYNVIIAPLCGNNQCPPCIFKIIIEEPNPCICQCNISGITVGTNIVFEGDTVDFINWIIPVNLTPISFSGNCLPQNSCLTIISWEIINPDGVSQSGGFPNNSTLHYSFNQEGIYTCTVRMKCSDISNINCYTICEKQFFVNVKDVPVLPPPPAEPGPIGAINTWPIYIINNYNPNDGIPNAIIPGPQDITQTGKDGGKLTGTNVHFAMSPGEPVPGAEIYLEIEPDEEPIANIGTTGNKGSSIFPNKPQLISKVNGKNVSYKMQLKIPADYYLSKLKESNVGVVEFDYTIKTDKSDIVYKILVGGNGDNPDIPIIKVWQIYQGASGGPYSQSVSNMEDDSIINIELPFDNIYGVKLISGSLNCSSINASILNEKGGK